MRKARKFPHYKALDGVRGFAALLVFLNHGLFTSPITESAPGVVAFYHRYCIDFGIFAVDLFFVLSGYLISSLLLLDRRRPHFYNNFYWKRVFRILPALLLVLVVTYATGLQTTWGVILTLLFIINYDPIFKLPATGPFWSLAIEEQFYLVWPAVVRNLNARAMRSLLVAILVAEPILRFISVYLHHGNTLYTFVHCDGLAWGALLAYVAYSHRVPYPGGDSKKLWRKFGVPVGILGIVLAIPDIIAILLHGQGRFSITLTWSPMLFASLICFLITHPGSRTARFFSLRSMVFFGNISYMFYLSHTYLLEAYNLYVPSYRDHPDFAGYLIRLPIVFAVTVALCTLSLYFFERPVGKLRRYFVK